VLDDPIQDLDARIGGEAFQGPFPPRVEFYPALRPGRIATPWTEVSRCPRSSDLANKINPAVQLIRQRGDHFAWPDSFIWIHVSVIPNGRLIKRIGLW
jgi:hypothetical protein